MSIQSTPPTSVPGWGDDVLSVKAAGHVEAQAPLILSVANSNHRIQFVRDDFTLSGSPQVRPNTALSAVRQQRMDAMRDYAAKVSEEFGLWSVPEIYVDTQIRGDAWFDESTGNIALRPEFLDLPGHRAAKLLTHELIHAQQYQSGNWAFNFPDQGLYVEAPQGPMWSVFLNPFKLVRLIAYALQPIELHAELKRIGLRLTGQLPKAPW